MTEEEIKQKFELKNIRAAIREKEHQRSIEDDYAAQFDKKYAEPMPDRNVYHLYLTDEEVGLLYELIEKEQARLGKLKSNSARDHVSRNLEHIHKTLRDN